jgi:SAM-dependent methyltransferase
VTTASTRDVYNANARSWTRNGRILLSDFTARPYVIEELAPLARAHVLDLGCGEGYVARLAGEAGAASVAGIDISQEMIANARAATPDGVACAHSFETGDASLPRSFTREHYDRIMAVFLFNYLTRAQTLSVLKVARRLLAPGGIFVFTVPHPCFPYMRAPDAPFYFQSEGQSYFDGVDATFEGEIWRRDDVKLPVRCVHKTIGDYFDLLSEAGWTHLPKLLELRVRPEHVAEDPGFFSPLVGYPLHLLFRLEVQ